MPMRPGATGLILLALLLLTPPTQAAPATGAAGVVESVLRQGRADAAFARGQELFADHAGDPDFDFQFGLAALESGHHEHAALAFRRVLLARPDSDRARLELGRALFLAGDDAGARREFRRVLRRDPPPAVAARVQEFLDAIDRRAAARKPRLTPSLALRLGHDDNVGNATDREVYLVALPDIAFSVPREEDGFVELNLGLDYLHPLDKHWGVFAGGGYTHRGYASIDGFDLGVLDLRGGVVRADGKQRLRVPVQLQALSIDGEGFRRLFSLGGEWSRMLGARSEFGLFAQLASVRYPDLPEFDVDGFNLGLMLGHRTAGGLQLSGGLFAGSEEAREAAGEHNGRDFVGVRLALSWPFVTGHALDAVAAWQEVGYAAPHPMFARERDDEVLQFELAWKWQPAERWEWRTAALYYDSGSSISLYDYDRLQLITGVRYVWK